MGYSTKKTVTTAPTILNGDSITGNIGTSKTHIIQANGADVIVDLEIGGSGVFTTVATVPDGDALNIDAFNVSQMRLTAASGSAVVSVAAY